MSLRLRLALWYGALTGIVLALVALTTYAIHTRAHYDDLDRVLAQAAEHVADEYRTTTTAAQLTSLLRDPVAPDVVVQVYDDDGVRLPLDGGAAPDVDPRRVLAQPSTSPIDRIARLAPSIVDVPAGHGGFSVVTDETGTRWRLYALHVSDRESYLLAAAPLDRLDASVHRFRLLLLLLTLGGMGVTLLSGVLLAHRALRPVSLLTETAAGIAESRELGRRVPVVNQRDELGELAATFNGMLTSLDEAHRVQQRFVSDASHELRAPLTIVQANLELVERSADLPPAERQAALDEAAGEVRRLTQLVADLLALARADAGAALQRRPVELDRVVLDAFGEARHLARGQRLAVTGMQPLVVSGDPDRLKQLLLILLDNALKYTPAERQVAVALVRRDGWAELTVRDEGVGIPPADVPHVFERFYRADPARSRDPGGTGLGLPIARWIVEQHGGSIRLTSELGQGTRVAVRLPLGD